MVLGKHAVPGRPTYLINSRARACCICSRCGWGCLDIFSLIYHFSLGDGPIKNEIRPQRAVKPKNKGHISRSFRPTKKILAEPLCWAKKTISCD